MLIPSKLSRPVRLDHTVVRERLLAKLSGANNFRLALVTSPAGYGKTTLVSQWAAGKNELGWYSLDEGDNQQERFASYLIAAIQQATGGHCSTSEAMAQKRQYASLTSLFAQLFIELAQWHRPLYLVIDDYHLITNPVIHDAMRFSYVISRKISPWWCYRVICHNWASLTCACAISCWKSAASSWLLTIRKQSNFLTVVFRRPLKPLRAAACATMWPVGPLRYS